MLILLFWSKYELKYLCDVSDMQAYILASVRHVEYTYVRALKHQCNGDLESAPDGISNREYHLTRDHTRVHETVTDSSRI